MLTKRFDYQFPAFLRLVLQSSSTGRQGNRNSESLEKCSSWNAPITRESKCKSDIIRLMISSQKMSIVRIHWVTVKIPLSLTLTHLERVRSVLYVYKYQHFSISDHITNLNKPE